MSKTTPRRRYGITCPHCGARTQVRNSEGITPTYRNALLECMDPACGWRGSMDLVITHTLTPSLKPDARIRVPLSPGAAKRLQEELEAAGASPAASQ